MKLDPLANWVCGRKSDVGAKPSRAPFLPLVMTDPDWLQIPSNHQHPETSLPNELIENAIRRCAAAALENLRFLVNKSLFINVWVVSASVCCCCFFFRLLALFIKANGLRFLFYVYVALAATLQWESRAKKNIVRRAHKALAGAEPRDSLIKSHPRVKACRYRLPSHPSPDSSFAGGTRLPRNTNGLASKQRRLTVGTFQEAVLISR